MYPTKAADLVERAKAIQRRAKSSKGKNAGNLQTRTRNGIQVNWLNFTCIIQDY